MRRPGWCAGRWPAPSRRHRVTDLGPPRLRGVPEPAGGPRQRVHCGGHCQLTILPAKFVLARCNCPRTDSSPGCTRSAPGSSPRLSAATSTPVAGRAAPPTPARGLGGAPPGTSGCAGHFQGRPVSSGGRGGLGPGLTGPVDGLVRGDAEQPGPQTGLAPVVLEVPPCTDKGVLDHLLHVTVIGQHAPRVAVEGRAVPVHDRLEGLPVTHPCRPGQGGVTHLVGAPILRGHPGSPFCRRQHHTATRA